MRRFIAAAAVAALGFAGGANADFFPGQSVAINGFAGPEFNGSLWGTHANQGAHQLGGHSDYFDGQFGPFFAITVDSSFLSPNALSFLFDFSLFVPGDYTSIAFDIVGLKTDGSISGVFASQGAIVTDGNTVSWTGSGDELAASPLLKVVVEQVPAPSALALVGLAGLAARRRRA